MDESSNLIRQRNNFTFNDFEFKFKSDENQASKSDQNFSEVKQNQDTSIESSTSDNSEYSLGIDNNALIPNLTTTSDSIRNDSYKFKPKADKKQDALSDQNMFKVAQNQKISNKSSSNKSQENSTTPTLMRPSKFLKKAPQTFTTSLQRSSFMTKLQKSNETKNRVF